MDNKINSNFKAVIFDMDGVITNTMPYHFDAWVKVYAQAGIKVNCYDIYKREGQDGLSTIKDIFKEKKLQFSLKTAKILLQKKEELFKKIVKLRFIRGSRPFIRKLKEHGLILGLVTGTSRHEMQKILPKSIRSLFQVTVTGDEVKIGKPHPEPFLKALRLLKIPAKEVMVIENAPFGIESAKRARLFCLALETSLPRKFLRRADIILKSYKELNRHINFEVRHGA